MDRTDTVTMEIPISGAVTVTGTLLPTVPYMIQTAKVTPIPLMATALIAAGIAAGNLCASLSIEE